jgi:hypothetical protein
MNKLYTFGCSFTEDFDPFMACPDTTRYKYVMNYHNGIVPKSWPQIMAEDLGMELKNYGGIGGFTTETGDEGNCNFSIFNNICQASTDFQKGDVVIIEWTFMERFKWVNFEGDRIITILPNQIPKDLDKDKDVIENILLNRTHKIWIEELFKYQILINKLSESVGFDVYYWTIDDKIVQHKFTTIRKDKKWLLSNKLYPKEDYGAIVRKNYGLTITDESNGSINDSHMGSSGHKVLADLFLKYIK